MFRRKLLLPDICSPVDFLKSKNYMKDFSYITSAHPTFVEHQYQDFLKDASSVDPELKRFFEGFDFAMTYSAGLSGEKSPGVRVDGLSAGAGTDWRKELGAYRMILGYRNKGHLIAKTNPIRPRKDRGANLELSFFGLSDSDLDKDFYAGNLIGLGTTTLREILAHLSRCYAEQVGSEFKYISN